MNNLSPIGLLIFFNCCAPNQETSTREEPAGYSLDSKPLYSPQESVESRYRKDSLLLIAKTNYLKDSVKLDNIIWYGRRLAYLSRYPEAISVYTRGLAAHPGAPELLRHRGHRFISIRKFDDAIADLTKAAMTTRGRVVETEPDGIPNRLNIPLSNLQFNIWYHLGLAYYLNGDYDRAAIAYDSCMRYSINPDLLCATTDWYYMALMRSGRKEDAAALLRAISPDIEVIENDGYLQRLMMYQGRIRPDSLLQFDRITEENELNVVTQGYGVSFYLEQQGDTMRAREIRDRILETSYWSAFGYIAAEADKFRRNR
jgi:tetratricopeptide (TPR) repeat protein